MSTALDEERERAVALSLGAADSDAPVWIQIARVGQWYGHPSGPFQLGGTQFDEMVRSFKATRNKLVPIDFEHVSEMDPREGTVPKEGAPAQGWITALDNRGDDGLWALVEWLEPARGLIKAKKYKFFSPTIRFNSKHPESGVRTGAKLSSGALTNQPFLDGMTPLTAKDNGAPSVPEKDDDTMDQTTEIANLKAQVAKLTGENAVLLSEKTALTNADAAMKLSLKDVEGKATAAETELATLRKFKTDTEASATADRVSLAFANYKDAKALTEDEKPAMAIVLSSNPALFEKLYPKLEAGTSHLLSNLTGQGEGGSRQIAAKDAKEDAIESIVSLADKIQAEKKCDRDTAFAEAERQLRSR